MKPGFRMLPLILGLALAACGDDKNPITGRDDDGNGGLNCSTVGTASINVTGAVTGTTNTCTAYSVQVDDPANPVFVMSSSSSADTNAAHGLFITRDGGRLATGTHTVGDLAGQISGFYSKNTEPSRLFFFESGSINVTTSNAGTLSGTMNISALELGSTATVTISGSFTAKCTALPPDFAC